jgi:hypothetical protein
MAAVSCKITHTGTPSFSLCRIQIGSRRIGLSDSVKFPVPLATGTYDVVWELRGNPGVSVALEVSANGKVIATLPAQTIAPGKVRIGSGSDPKQPGYAPLKINVP